MKQENAYKIKLLKLLEILRQDSDEDHYIGTTELIDKLADMGIVCDRRTLYKDIEVLNNFGYEVLCEKSPGKPNCYCVADRSFDVPELRILMDAVQAASFVTPSKTEVLLDKIADLGGSHRAELLQSKVRFFVMNETDRTSGAVIEKLDANNIAHCYMDEFAQDAIQPYKNIVLRQNLQLILDKFNQEGVLETLSVDEMLEIIFRRSCVNGHYKQIEKEKQDFYVKYIKKLRLVIEDCDGQNYYKIEVGK